MPQLSPRSVNNFNEFPDPYRQTLDGLSLNGMRHAEYLLTQSRATPVPVYGLADTTATRSRRQARGSRRSWIAHAVRPPARLLVSVFLILILLVALAALMPGR
jgi:hypothetical protein